MLLQLKIILKIINWEKENDYIILLQYNHGSAKGNVLREERAQIYTPY